MVCSGSTVGTWLFNVARIHGIEPDASNPGCFQDQIARELATFPCHHMTSREGKTKRIRLIVKVENDFSCHSTSPRDYQPCGAPAGNKINRAAVRLRREWTRRTFL